MKKYSISNLDANKSNVKKEEVQETSCGKRRSPSFGVLKGVKTQSVFKYMCVAAIVIAASCFMTGCQKEEDTIAESDNMEYIDIPEISEIMSDPMWFVDNSTSSEKYYKALRRFDTHIDLENGYLEVKIINGEEIGISEQLFEMFNDECLLINQNVKDGKYQLAKRDGHIVIVENIISGYTRLKNGSPEKGGTGGTGGTWTPTNLNQSSSQNRGMAVLETMKYYWKNRSTINSINTLFNMSSGYFGGRGYMSGYFTYNGYTYNWFLGGRCQNLGEPDDCIWSNVQSDYKTSWTQGGILQVNNKSGAMFTIHSSQAGSYTALCNYVFN
jgi:hypothetical protein